MGVPFYYRYLTRQYRDIASIKRKREVVEKFSNERAESLSLDLNGIIHNEAQKIYKYGSHEPEDPRELEALKKMDKDELEYNHMVAITESIFNLVKLVKPLNTLIIGIDGPAPYSKLYQQKQRRYKAKSIVLNEQTEDEYMEFETKKPSDSIFDSNSITPGTEFMEKLNVFIKEWIKLNREQLPFRIIYSSHRVPGEGEHKIAHHLRTLSFPQRNFTTTHVVYGLDADLILLGLLSPIKNYTLLRDDVNDTGFVYHVLNVDLLREKIKKEVGSIEDYVLIGFFAGNDFLPSFPSISIGNNGIDKLINLYRQTKSKLINVKFNTINWDNLKKFFKLFMENEDKLLADQILIATKYKSIPLSEAYDLKANKLDHTKYRQSYYKRALSNKSHNELYNTDLEKNRLNMAEEWLSGIAWVYKYYTEGINAVNVAWSYKYNYVPLGKEIYNVLENPSPQIEWQAIDYKGKILRPFEQLLSVLPPGSVNLIPENLRSLMLDKDSPISDLFPSKFLADLNGKVKDHEAVALIPFIEGERVAKEVAKLNIKDEKNEFERDLFFMKYSLKF